MNVYFRLHILFYNIDFRICSGKYNCHINILNNGAIDNDF